VTVQKWLNATIPAGENHNENAATAAAEKLPTRRFLVKMWKYVQTHLASEVDVEGK